MTQASVWILADDRPGNNNQALGVAEALGQPFRRLDITYGAAVKLPNFLRVIGPSGITAESMAQLEAAWKEAPPRVVIAAGRRLAPLLRRLKKRNPSLVAVQLMRPNLPASDFDLVVLPAHDGEDTSDSRYLITEGSPHRLTGESLHQARETWRPNFGSLPAPLVALLVGGDSKHGQFTEAHYRFLGQWSRELAGSGSLLATTSRRTGQTGEALLREAVTSHPHHFFHGWQQTGENPYAGMLAWAQAIIVTGDSMSMCTEACATGVPVFIYAPEGSVSAKHRRLHEGLVAKGHARMLTDATSPSLGGLTTPLANPAEKIAAHIRHLLEARPTGQTNR
jgi:mitochondrial fission protein ELM1